MLFNQFKINCFRRPFGTAIIQDNDVYSKYSSKFARKHFIDYYVNEHNHKFVPSSSVVPYLDSSLPFVNAGMCQFKNIYLGKEDAKFPSAANSQKCIRYNDVNVIGDTCHHTFFEMLGNWSFRSYFKKDACKLAWNLLTKPPFSISPDRLFVTYFSGDKNLSLPPDIEVRDTWALLGVPGNRIVPFGMKENFWNMGFTGPCGPCTEIHIALTSDAMSKSHLLNTDHPHLIELWNIVFISYNRHEDNSLEPLKSQFVDTGMGFERLVAVLQGQVSTYDTDLFIPLFDAISKIANAPKYEMNSPLYMPYRVLADYARMVTVAIADNAFPEINNKVRKILRKAMVIARKDFGMSEPYLLINELTNYIADSLSEAYPNISDNLPKIKHVVQYEAELLKNIIRHDEDTWNHMFSQCPSLECYIKEEYPALPQAFNYMLKYVEECTTGMIPAKDVCYLHETFGLDTEVIKNITQSFGLEVAWKEVNYLMESEKWRDFIDEKESSVPVWLKMMNKTVSQTDDKWKYEYDRLECPPKSGINYEFPELAATVQAIIKNDAIVSQIPEDFHKFQVADGIHEVRINDEHSSLEIITDKTNFYTSAGGQPSDVGYATVVNRCDQRITFSVTDTRKFSNYITHRLVLMQDDDYRKHPNVKISAGDRVNLKINEHVRLSHMRNHTALHLLNASLKKLLPVSCTKSSRLNDTSSTLMVAVFGTPFDVKELVTLEQMIKDIISSSLPVSRYTVCGFELMSIPDIILAPKVTYPAQNIHIISVEDHKNVVSREACCGTHVLNTADIGEFCFVSLKKSDTSHPILKCVTGEAAKAVLINSEKYLEQIQIFAGKVNNLLNRDDHTFEDVERANYAFVQFKKDFNDHRSDDNLHYFRLVQITDILHDVSKRMKQRLLYISRKAAEDDLKLMLKDERGNPVKYLVHVLDIKEAFHEYVSLYELVKVCNDIPTVLFFYKKGRLRSCCRVPKNLITEEFSAVKWMTPVYEAIDAKPPFTNQNQDSQRICFMHPLTVKPDKLSDVIKLASKMATDIVIRYC